MNYIDEIYKLSNFIQQINSNENLTKELKTKLISDVDTQIENIKRKNEQHIHFLPIAPIDVLKKNMYDSNGIRSHVMMLAHLCSNSTYLNFYLNSNKNRQFILLDNGAAENSQISENELIDLAIKVNPTVVIAPDTLWNGISTIGKSIRFAQQLRKSNNKIKIMAVPQGSTIEEYLTAFDTFNNSELFDWIGISKFVAVKPYSDRISCLMDIVKYNSINKPIHLLGCNNPIEIAFAKNIPQIKSIDSCIAYLYCHTNNIPLDNSLEKRLNTPQDFFNWTMNESQIANSLCNVQKIDELCEFNKGYFLE